MSSVEVLFLNATLYTVMLFYFLKKYQMSVGVVVWGLYTVSAWSSFLFVQQPGYIGTIHDTEQTLLPCLYLFCVMLLAMWPLMRFYKIENINFERNWKLLKAIMIICMLIQFVFIIVDLPTVINNITSGTALLNSLRANIYGDSGVSKVTQNVWLNRVYLLHTGIRILASGLSVIVFITAEKNRRIVNFFALSCLLNNLRLIIVQVGRGEMIMVFLMYACMIYLMRDYLSKRVKRLVIIVSIPIVIVMAIFFWAISISRFGDNAGFFLYKYLGEPMNNFNGILWKNIKGSTNGQAYFSLIYRYLFGESTGVTADEKWAIIKSVTGIRGDIFYTWVGGLIIEFGKIAPFFVAIILNRLLTGISSIKSYFTGDLALLVFFVNFYIRGVFIFPTQNFEGMTMIAYTILLYLFFRLKKGENGHLVYVRVRKRNL